MDVIPHASTIFGRVVIAKNTQLGSFTYRYLTDKRHQVVGNAIRIFANQAAFIGTDRVKVTQQGNGPGRIGSGQIFQYEFNHQLALTIGVGSRAGRGFNNGHGFGVTVDSGG